MSSKDEYEYKPISLITDDERIKDAENQRELLIELSQIGWESKCVCIFERIDPIYSMEEPVRAILTFAMSLDDTIGAMQISNPYLNTYQQRFYRGLNKSYRCYHLNKKAIENYRNAKLIFEGRMNSNVKFS